MHDRVQVMHSWKQPEFRGIESKMTWPDSAVVVDKRGASPYLVLCSIPIKEKSLVLDRRERHSQDAFLSSARRRSSIRPMEVKKIFEPEFHATKPSKSMIMRVPS